MYRKLYIVLIWINGSGWRSIFFLNSISSLFLSPLLPISYLFPSPHFISFIQFVTCFSIAPSILFLPLFPLFTISFPLSHALFLFSILKNSHTYLSRFFHLFLCILHLSCVPVTSLSVPCTLSPLLLVPLTPSCTCTLSISSNSICTISTSPNCTCNL